MLLVGSKSVAGMEFIIEFLEVLQDCLHVRGGIDEVRDTEMISPFLLAESRSWHSHNACLVDHLEAVDEVRCLSLLLGFIDKLVREVNLREAIHGAFNFSAGDLLHVVKSASEKFSAFLKTIEDQITLFLVRLNTFVRLAAEVGRIGHEIDGDLANSV